MKPNMVAIASLTALMVVLLFPASEAVITCSDVINDLRPCIQYLIKGTGVPTAACCDGASKLASAASTSSDKKVACACIKSAAQKFNANVAAAKDLPGKCGITLPYSISPSVDCSKIS